MEARLYRIATAIAILASACSVDAFAASVRTQNFIIEAEDPDFARKTAELAETYRRDLALEWLGKELPPWREPCPIRVIYHAQAQGVTSFVFDHQGVPGRWTMEVLGPPERILDAVLPHEITHTVFATHFGRPLPRWADEGACTTVEHASERIKHERNLIRYLKTDYGIAFNKMVAMKEYPRDPTAMLALYAQGYSVARYLILQGGRQRFVKFVEYGMATNNWNAAINKHYGYQDLSDLQVTWLDWVRVGSPQDLPGRSDGVMLAGGAQPGTGASDGGVIRAGGIAAPPVPAGEALAAVPPAAPNVGALASVAASSSALAMTPDGSPMTVVRGENGSELRFYEKQREQYLSRVGVSGGEPVPDNRRPLPSAPTAVAPPSNQVAGNALPPNLAPTPGTVQQMSPDLWSGGAGPTARLSDARPVPGTQPGGPARLAPVDSAPPAAPRFEYGTGGTLLR